jgi:pimeloyl-ACP methyl ester carboxylesterase
LEIISGEMSSVPLGLAVLVACIGLGWIGHRIASSIEARRFRPPGNRIHVGGRGFHFHVEGAGSPVVVLDSALAGTSLSWYEVQPRVAAFSRVVSYDRGGFGWSDRPGAPRRVDQFVAELRSGLARAGLEPPYVLVGHSYGGWVARLFASRHPNEVAGMVLVDVPHPSEWAQPGEEQQRRVARGVRLSRRAALLAPFGFTRLLFRIASKGVPLGDGAPSERGRIATLLGKVPEKLRGPIRSFWVQRRTLEALASLIEEAPASARLVEAETKPLGAMPLAVLSASNPSAERLRDQERVRSLSSRGRHEIAKGSGHWIPLDEPGLIVNAIREVVEEVREA